MIQPLLKYQSKEKEKIKLQSAVEGGKVKRELDEATKTSNATKQLVLSLDAEAKSIMSLIEAVRKNMGELLQRAEGIIRDNKTMDNEDEINSALSYSSTIADKLAGYEKELQSLTRKINDKSAQFEDARAKLVRATKLVQSLTPEYEKQKEKIAPDVARIEKELATLAKDVDTKLMERYKKARSAEKGLKDVVVTLAGERCGGCLFELPLALVHKIATSGYIICEECGKVIYK